jgi:hypothetical protein
MVNQAIDQATVYWTNHPTTLEQAQEAINTVLTWVGEPSTRPSLSRGQARISRQPTPYQRDLARFARETPDERRTRLRNTINSSNLARQQRFIDNNQGSYTGLGQLNRRLSTMNNLTDLQSLLTTAHTPISTSSHS